VEARTQRELALAELSLVIVGVPPANAPLLGQFSGAVPAQKGGKKTNLERD
jgi:hypothetical protein